MRVTWSTILLCIAAMACSSNDSTPPAGDTGTSYPEPDVVTEDIGSTDNGETTGTDPGDTSNPDDDAGADSEDPPDAGDNPDATPPCSNFGEGCTDDAGCCNDLVCKDAVCTTPGPEPCSCPSTQHCDEEGKCVANVCTAGATTCTENLDGLIVCNDDGSDFETVPCADDEKCDLGQCLKTICEPGSPPICKDGQRMKCKSSGTGYAPLPCPTGTGCSDGECIGIEPNVLLIVDSSNSMNWVDSQEGTLADCQGEDDCAPWAWPNCDD